MESHPPDYSHRFHAGNIGDVWKHCILVATLRAVSLGGGVVYLDTHAGEGTYALGGTGEWSEGIGRLRTEAAPDDTAVGAYLAMVRSLVPDTAEGLRQYPGSPAFAAATLGPSARLDCWERDDHTVRLLTVALRGDTRVHVYHGDGLAGLPAALDARTDRPDETVVLIDPPYSTKAEWLAVPDALIAAVARRPAARFLLWYPVKSLTRPNALLARLEAAGVGGTTAELITTPLELQRNRLNGSGVVLINPAVGVLSAIAAAAPVLGPRCATQRGAWSMRMRTWA